MTNEELCFRYRTGDREAANDLIFSNMTFIRAYAVKYHRAYRNVRLDADDYTQTASLAFLRAAECFDPARGVPFLSYAGQVIRNAILDEIRKAYPEQGAISYEEASLSDMGISGWSDSIRKDYAPCAWSSYSDNPEHILLKKEQYEEIHTAMEKLTLRENTWVRYRFGFDDEPVSLARAAQNFYLSESRAERLERGALQRVRGYMSICSW